MKNKMISTLLLSALMMKAPGSVAMEPGDEEGLQTAPRTFATRPIPQESPLLNLPPDIRHYILTLLDPRSFFDFKETSRMSYGIADDPRFYLEKTPAALMDYLEKCIDKKNQKIHLSPLIPLIRRTQNTGDLFFNVAQRYSGSLFDQTSSERTPEELQQLMEAWQPYGLALRLGKSVDHPGAKNKYDELSMLPFTRQHVVEHFFLLLLPVVSWTLSMQTKQGIQEYRFLNLEKKLAQGNEEKYMGSTREALAPKFTAAFQHVQSVFYSTTDPSLKNFLRKKELRLIDNHIHTLRKFLKGKGPGTPKVKLKQALRQAALRAETAYYNTVKKIESSSQKAAYFLKLASLLEEVGETKKAGVNYHCASSNIEDPAKKVEYGLKAAALFEKLGDKLRAAKMYVGIALYFPDRAEQIACLSKVIDFSQELGEKPILAFAYGNMANTLENPAEKIMYGLKTAALFEELGDKKQMAQAYQNLAIYYKDPVQIIAYGLQSVALYAELGDKAGMAKVYGNMATVEDPAQVREYGLKAVALHEELGNLSSAAECYLRMALMTKNRDEKMALFSKAISLYEQEDNYKELVELYLVRTILAESNAERVETLKTAFSLATEKTKSKKRSFYTSFLLSLTVNSENERAMWRETRNAYWQAIAKTPQNRKSLDKTVQELCDFQQESLAGILAQFVAENWPQEKEGRSRS